MTAKIFVWCAIPFLFCSHDGNPDLSRTLLEIGRKGEIRLWGRNPDINSHVQRIHQMASVLRPRLEKRKSTREKIDAINAFLFDEQGFVPVMDSGFSQPCYLNRLLDEKHGPCLTLAGLYLCLARQMDLPVCAVLLPGHVFVRWQTPDEQWNIEILRKGMIRENAFYRDWFKVDSRDRHYMRNLSDKEVSGLFSFNLGNEYRKRDLLEDAADEYKNAISAFPDFAGAHANLARIYRQFGQAKMAEIELKKAFEIAPSLFDSASRN